MALTSGERIGSYKIVSLLHTGGGTGEVYLAEDIRLDRVVAVKVLRPELSEDEQRLRRFEQDVRAASALNHPNIVTIYGVTRDGDGSTTYVAMEYVEGETLRKILNRGRVSIRELLRYGTQIAEALVKAHAAGILHGDLRPENIMVSKDGFVKILDFGLAELVPRSEIVSQSEQVTRLLGGADAVLRAIAYTSPEQAKGQGVDFRADQFSLGLILYEMLTGRHAFLQGTSAQTAASIVDSEPPAITGGDPKIPRQLSSIVERCLQKDPGGRFDSTQELASELKTIRDSSAGGHKASPRSASSRSLRGRWIAFALTMFVILAGIVLFTRLLQDQPPLRFTNATQVTTAIGVEDYPSWSPDGAMVVYQSNQRGNWDIWVKQLNSGQPLNRTEDFEGDDAYPSWSPDGSQIAFWSDRDGGGYFVMSPLAGVPSRVEAMMVSPFKSDVVEVSPPQWSADGTRVAYVVWESTGVFAEIVSMDSGVRRRVALPGRTLGRFDLSWSPDGRFFAYVDAQAREANVAQLWILRLDDGASRALTDGRTNDRSPSWSSDGRTLFFLSNRGGSMDLWRQPMRPDGTPRGAAEPMTVGIGMRYATFSRDGSRFAYSQGRHVGNVWRVPVGLDRPATWGDAKQVTFEQAFIEHVDVSPDGERLLIGSDRRGNPDLWMMSLAGGDIQQLTSDPTPDWAPKWSPDAKQIAFYSHRAGSRDIWVMPLEGGPARQLTEGEAEDLDPSWSPDGEEIAFFSDRSGNWDIWVVPAQGGEPRQLTSDAGADNFVDWYPDGKWLTFRSNRTGESRLWRVPAAGGDAEPLTRGPGVIPRWTPDAQYVFFKGIDERDGNIWAYSADDGVERPITDLVGKPGRLGQDSLATDGDQVFFIWEEDLWDLWVMDVAHVSPR